MSPLLPLLLLSAELSFAEPTSGGDVAAPAASEAGAPAVGTLPPSSAPGLTPLAAAPTPASAVNAVDPSEIVGAPAGPPLSGDALDAQTHAVSKLLRCPVCQGLSVADSPSESALAMKAEVQDLVARGYDEEQILLYFEASYGEFIRLEPTFEGFNVAVWLAPVGLVVAGLGVIGALLRVSRRRGSAGSGVPSPRAGAAPPPIDPELEPYLRRVREESR